MKHKCLAYTEWIFEGPTGDKHVCGYVGLDLKYHSSKLGDDFDLCTLTKNGGFYAHVELYGPSKYTVTWRK